MKKLTLISTLALSSLLFFAACGEQGTTENVTNINQIGMEVVSSVKDLPKCTKDNEGEQALVKGETSVRVCVDGKWFATVPKSDTVYVQGGVDTLVVAGDTVYLDGGDFSCTTKELMDKSGLKIICNGDSIGVVLNGAKGETGAKGDKGDAGEQGIQGKTGEQGIQGDKGDDGASCSIVGQTDSTVTIKCGEKSVVLNLGGKGGSDIVDTLELDSEKIAVSLDTLSGFSQKGPFLKGSTVYLYELSDGRTLKQTNGNFTSEITSDDGRYTFQSRDLVSQYALIVVDGKYRNEVTGKPTSTAIKLQAYTNMLMHKSANVNLLTHLEKNRVFYLVTQKNMTVRAAKKQAQAEIFSQFHIDTTGFKSESEDLDVFGKTDADAALLAISILLQGDSSETALSVLLTEISNDMEKDGKWDGENAAATKAKIADWAMVADSANKLATFSTNVTNWGLGDAPDFAKFVRDFWYKEYGIDSCTGKRDGEVIATKNEKSDYYNTKLRFICRDGAWKPANEFEKDTYGNKCTADSVGKVISGVVNSTNKYYCFASGWVSVMGWSWSIPKEVRLNPEIEYDTYKDPRDQKVYNIVTIAPKGSGYSRTWFAENLNYADSSKTSSLKGRSWCYNNVAKNCDVGGRMYTWAAAIDSVKLATDADNPQDCGYGKTCDLASASSATLVQGICPAGWHLPSKSEWEALFTAVGGQSKAGKILKSQTGWIINGNGTDAFGFAALPAGGRNYNGNFFYEGYDAFFWSSAEDGTSLAYVVYLYYNLENAPLNDHNKNNAFSVRCVKD
ncbi:FISUMP domain-containing protein [uncultured Fibrobacter sp.]|uniref:fibrobacter succinogenes major paralogous domain-containing protein n=1 Tax=uncultured Fibrobacter sp. TaxID=261512 RepID=UPI00261BEF3C|nr:FISUMP domain-containing protein [uncultured Fibrobacter sp.]